MKNTTAIIGVIISMTILLFGNNIIGRLFSGNENVAHTKKEASKKEEAGEIRKENKISETEILDKSSLVVSHESNAKTDYNSTNIERLTDEYLNPTSDSFDELIKNREFETAIEVLSLAKKRTSNSILHKEIEDRKKSILLMIEKDFDNVWFNFPSDLILTEKGGKQGLYTRKGTEIVEPIYDEIDPISFYPLLLSKIGNKYGFINQEGEELFSPIFDYVEPYYFDPLFLVEENGKSGFVNKNGDMVIKPQFSAIGSQEKELLVVKRNHKWGLIDTLGKEIVKIQYDTIAEFDENGIALAKLKGKKLFVNLEGKIVKNPAFD